MAKDIELGIANESGEGDNSAITGPEAVNRSVSALAAISSSRQQRKPESMAVDSVTPQNLKKMAQWLALAGISIGSVAALFAILYAFFSDYNLFKSVLAEHVRAIVGIPMAAVSSFCVVIILESRSGRIEFEVAGLKFRGAAGPVVLWIFGFMTFSLAIRLLW